jgi:hypothetical protein
MPAMAAASLQLQVAASNIVNASSSGPVPGSPNANDFPNAYAAQRVSQSEAPGGGVKPSQPSVNAVGFLYVGTRIELIE